MDRLSRVAAIVIICASFSCINAQIPRPCGNWETLSSQECCPAPTATEDAGQCGSNLTPPRGSCASISAIVKGLQLDSSSTDNRMNWPHYFNKLCKCNDNYAGYDCGECKFGFRGDRCDKRHMRKRRSITSLNPSDRKKYIDALKMAKSASYSRYMAIANDVAPPNTSLVSVPLYDLFTWIHFFVGRENAQISNPIMYPNGK